MYSPKQILKAAQVIQPILPKLLSESIAAEMQSNLQSLIESEDTNQIWDNLDQYPQTRQWRIQYLKSENSSINRSNSQLPGNQVAQSSGIVFACPQCDYRYTIFFKGMEPEPCDRHPNAELCRV